MKSGIYLRFALLLTTLLLLPAQADEQQEREKLRQLAGKIQRLQESLSTSSKEVEALNKTLRKNEIHVSTLQKDIDKITRSVGELNNKLKKLAQEQDRLLAAKQQQKSAIIAEINTSYRLGKEQTLKLLLNQEDPEKVSRVLRYHGYFLQARAERLTAYVDTLQSLEKVASDIHINKQQLVENRTELAQQKNTLLSQQKERQQVMAKLQASISTDELRLNQLKQQRQRLESVIQQLGEAISSIALPASQQPFHRQKGKMAWPAKGKLQKRFGSHRNKHIKWNGWLISAPQGTSVKAIHHGRVIFADYLRGQGMLVILDHGDGYMSLYGHNQVILKETGDWVQQGEVIAKVGNTGGQQQTALYFEIRHKGQPTNPSNWLGRT